MRNNRGHRSSRREVSRRTGRSQLAQVHSLVCSIHTAPIPPIIGARNVSHSMTISPFWIGNSPPNIGSPRWRKPNRPRIPAEYDDIEWVFVEVRLVACGIACSSKCRGSGRIVRSQRGLTCEAGCSEAIITAAKQFTPEALCSLGTKF